MHDRQNERERGGDTQLPLDHQRPGADDLAHRRVLNHEHVVRAVLARKEVVAVDKRLLADLAHGRQHAQAVEEARRVVGRAQGPQPVGRREGGGHLGADEVLAEEANGLGHGRRETVSTTEGKTTPLALGGSLEVFKVSERLGCNCQRMDKNQPTGGTRADLCPWEEALHWEHKERPLSSRFSRSR